MTEVEIKELYSQVAKAFGASERSTTEDANIRKLEVQKIIECLRFLYRGHTLKILEVGCGNGYTAEQIAKLRYQLTCIDFCEPLIEIAKQRNLENVKFFVSDVLDLQFADSSFDLVFSERCLVNLVSWEKQKKALNEIWRVLKPNGFYLMIEAFTDGLKNLNLARKAVGLDYIPIRWHNQYFDKTEFLTFIKGKFEEYPDLPFNETSNFLSTYYFGTRVLYPALIANKMELIQNNKFDEFFRYLQPYGNYAAIQLFVLQKVS